MWLRTICVRDKIQCWLSEFHPVWMKPRKNIFLHIQFPGNGQQSIKIWKCQLRHGFICLTTGYLDLSFGQKCPKVCVCMCVQAHICSQKQENIEISRIRLFGKKLWYGKNSRMKVLLCILLLADIYSWIRCITHTFSFSLKWGYPSIIEFWWGVSE